VDFALSGLLNIPDDFLAGDGLNHLDLRRDSFGCPRGLIGQTLQLRCDHREAFPRVTGAGCLIVAFSVRTSVCRPLHWAGGPIVIRIEKGCLEPFGM
jgi:hypothetical protein